MTAAGYTNVFDFGGISDWPYDTERAEHPVSRKRRQPNREKQRIIQLARLVHSRPRRSRGQTGKSGYLRRSKTDHGEFLGHLLRACIQCQRPTCPNWTEYRASGFQILGVITDVSKPEDEAALMMCKIVGTDYTQIIASTI